MNRILHPSHRAVLTPFFIEGTSLVFEYCGALIPKNDPRIGSTLSPTTRDLLKRIAAHYRLTILADAEHREILRSFAALRSVELLDCDRTQSESTDPIRALQMIGDWKKELEERLEGFSGLLVRDRLFSIVVDLRSTHSPRLAERAVRRVASQLEHARVSGTNGVIELHLPGYDHVPSLRHSAIQARSGSTLFIHGTGNQEGRLRLLASPHLLSIRVGDDPRFQGFCLRDQAEVNELLRVLAEGASEPSRDRESGWHASAT